MPPAGSAPSVDPAVLTTLVVACRDAERLRFDYRAHDGSPSRRTAEPHRLVSLGRRWYLVAWDVDRADWRTYRVDRITPLVPTGPRFAPRPLPDGDVASYVSRGVGSALWRYRAAVTVHASAIAVTERIPVAAGVVEAVADDRCVLHTGSDEVETLAVWLGALGADFEVEGPPELLAHLSVMAARYARSAVPRPPADPVSD